MKNKQKAIDQWTTWFMSAIGKTINNQDKRLAVKQHVNLALVGLAMTLETNQREIEKDGGACWFCDVKDDDLVVETEFDTYVHIDCVRARLKEYPLDPEANLMKYLFKPL
jgi:hypothetical protein